MGSKSLFQFSWLPLNLPPRQAAFKVVKVKRFFHPYLFLILNRDLSQAINLPHKMAFDKMILFDLFQLGLIFKTFRLRIYTSGGEAAGLCHVDRK